ncbi:MAG TPA: DUF5668 domain-containing protein [Bacteroidales bacterium]|jgi:hypothetical protein|nr:hypothetical protein [Bacteroidales bacterium]MDI9574233.1 DUF5668 domain-containing protein [Bacteroidota bacterium]OQC60469.1 MAG: hypothetical protein BWX51_00963 [Bacteroidetes bacterium ADurb.Bin012]MBP9512455.1 hypothetical protein [Bacteroidales bacterium]MBP9588949.1 hypothetical protein [Bacteroidales bacterium]
MEKKFRNVFWGVILLIIGVIFALRNFGIIHFTWRAVFDLWPILLILWGISILPAKPVLKMILGIFTGAIAITLLLTNPRDESRFYWEGWSYNEHRRYKERNWIPSNQKFVEPYDSAVKTAILKFDAAAGKFTIKDTTNKMVSFESYGNVGPFVMTSYDNEEGRNIKLSLEGVKIKGDIKNDVVIKLNPNPLWKFEIKAGAADMNMDLSSFRVRELNIEGGASLVELKLGHLSDTTNVSLEIGASHSVIYIPRQAGCQVESESVLSSRSLEGFHKLKSGLWQTPDFDESSQKIFIELKAAVSNIEIKRYP